MGGTHQRAQKEDGGNVVSLFGGTPQIALADARLVMRLRRGEPAALDQVWARWRDAIWSVCSAMAADRDEALWLLQSCYDGLYGAARGWRRDTGIRPQMAAHVWLCVQSGLGLAAPGTVAPRVPVDVAGPSRRAAAEIVAATPAPERLVFLLDLFFDGDVAALAPLIGVPEARVRAARAAVAWRLVDASGVR